MDLKNILSTVAPLLGNALTGGFAGTALTLLSKTLLNKNDGTENDLLDYLSKPLSNEDKLKLEKADNDFKLEMQRLVVTDNQNYLLDVQDARATHKNDGKVFLLGCGFLVIIPIMILLILSPYIDNNNDIEMMVIGSLLTIFGQIPNYYFGSSKGSADKTEMLRNMK